MAGIPGQAGLQATMAGGRWRHRGISAGKKRGVRVNQDETVAYLRSVYARNPQDSSAPSQLMELSPVAFEGHEGYRLDYTNGVGDLCIALVSIDVTKGELDELMTAGS
jgi:urease gamma subunit